MTGRFIADLGDRLAAWVDHHDHERHVALRGRPALRPRHQGRARRLPRDGDARARARAPGPVDTIVCHVDFDGLYAAAKWMLGGVEPYAGADDDARAVDTRIGDARAHRRA